MLTLYQFQISPFCDKVRRILQYKRLAYETREVPLAEVTLGYRKVNPIGKVPCLDHDGHRVADSTDIASYVEERFPERPLLPRDASERAQCHVLEDWADESLYFYEMTLRFTIPESARRWVPELVKHDPAPVRAVAPFVVPRAVAMTARSQGIGRKPRATLLHDVERHVTALSGLLGDRNWLIGGGITLADIAVFAQLFCIRGTDDGASLIDAAPAVGRWMARVDEETSPS